MGKNISGTGMDTKKVNMVPRNSEDHCFGFNGTNPRKRTWHWFGWPDYKKTVRKDRFYNHLSQHNHYHFFEPSKNSYCSRFWKRCPRNCFENNMELAWDRTKDYFDQKHFKAERNIRFKKCLGRRKGPIKYQCFKWVENSFIWRRGQADVTNLETDDSGGTLAGSFQGECVGE